MCKNCNEKSNVGTLVAIISGVVVLAAAVSAAIYFVMRFFEKKHECEYLDCDCYGDYPGYEPQFDEAEEDQAEAVTADTSASADEQAAETSESADAE